MLLLAIDNRKGFTIICAQALFFAPYFQHESELAGLLSRGDRSSKQMHQASPSRRPGGQPGAEGHVSNMVLLVLRWHFLKSEMANWQVESVSVRKEV